MSDSTAEAALPSKRQCFACGCELARGSFTEDGWNLGEGLRRCFHCVETNRAVPDMVQMDACSTIANDPLMQGFVPISEYQAVADLLLSRRDAIRDELAQLLQHSTVGRQWGDRASLLIVVGRGC